MAYRHPVRGYGTGKGRKKGTPNKVPHEAKQHIAGIVAGSVDATTLKMLAATKPLVYAELLRNPTVTRIMKLKRKPVLNTPTAPPKPKLPKEDTPDYEIIKEDLEKQFPGQTLVVKTMLDVMCERLGPSGMKQRANELRRDMMTPEEKREYWTHKLIEAKTERATVGKPKRRRTQRTYRIG